MHPLAKLDHAHVWHPFTQMRDWLKREPIVITSGKGAVLRDVHGKKYLDANSSIWTNLHGHQHPKINAAIKRQLKKISHSSALGFANEPASLLAANLVKAVNPKLETRNSPGFFSATTVPPRLKSRSSSPTSSPFARAGQSRSRASSRSKARITATRRARFRWATLICFTRRTPACCSRRTR